MAAELGEAFVRIRPDTDGFGRELGQDLDRETKRASLGLADAISVGAVVGGFAKITDAASQLEQAVGGTEAVFGEASSTIDEFAKSAAESAGLSKRAAREATSSIGALLQGFGFTRDEAAETSVQLSQLAADLSATFGGRPEEAVQALGAALRGETDPLERFGVALNQASVNAKAVELGLAESASKVDQNAKAQATLALITERSAAAQGQFAREADTAAGQAAIAAAEAENSAASLGENFLPIYTKLAEVVGTTANAFGSLPGPVQTAIVVLSAAAALAGPTRRSFDAISGSVDGMRARFAAASPRVQTLSRGLTGAAGAAAGIFAVAEAIDLLGSAINDGRFGDAVDDSDRLGDSLARLAQGQLVGALAEDFEGLVDAFSAGALGDALDDTAQSSTGLVAGLGLVTGALDDVAVGSEEAESQLDKVDKALASLLRLDPEVGQLAFDELVRRFEAAGVSGEVVRNVFDDTATALGDLESGALGASGQLDQIGDAAKATEIDFKSLGGAIGAVRREVEDLDRAVFGQRDAELDLEDAQLGVQDSALGVQDAQARYNEAVAEFGPNSREAQQAGVALRQSQIDLERSQLRVRDAQIALNDAMREQAAIIDGANRDSLGGYYQWLRDIEVQAPGTAGALGQVDDALRRIEERMTLLAAADAFGVVNSLGRNLAISIRTAARAAGRGEYGVPSRRPGG